MRLVLKTILKLPDIKLSSKQWDEFVFIINEFNITCGKEFIKTLQDQFSDEIYTIFPDIIVKRLKEYLDDWYNIFSLAMIFNIIMVEKWRDIHQKEIANDELLPLTIELINMDVPSLKIIHRKLSRAIQIFNTGEQGYTLINLYSAIEAKLMGASIDQETDDRSKQQILKVKKEIDLEDSVKKIFSICMKYKRNLFETFKERVNYLGFDHCFNQTAFANDQDLQKIITTCLSYSDLASTIQDPVLLSIIKKYTVMEDIYLSFNHQANEQDFRDELSEKIHQHQDILKTTPDQNYWAVLQSGYAGYRYLQKIKSLSAKENKLSKQLRFFSQNIQTQDDSELIFEKRLDLNL